MTLGELVARLGGKLVRGDQGKSITGVGEPRSATPSQLVFGEDSASARKVLGSLAGAVVLPETLEMPQGLESMAIVTARQPRLWFAQAARLLHEGGAVKGIHSTAVVPASATVGMGVSIGPGAVLGEGTEVGDRSCIDPGCVIGDSVRIGADCRLYPRVVVYAGTTLGDRVILHAGVVVGSDGFGYVRDSLTGRYTQFPQQGRLVIEDDVEIGANSTIDRGALGETRICRGAKLDNLVHIGHNCDIGEDVVIASQTGVSGSSTIGRGAILAGQVGVGDHARVGPGVILGGQAGVLSGKSLDTTGTVLWGTPARPLREYLREVATLSRLARRKKESQ